MRNPLHYSSELLVKRAEPILNIPTYTAPLAGGPSMSDEQIAMMLQNIQSYPEAQQQQILDAINKEYGNSGYRGGAVGSIFGNIGNWLGSFGNTLQQGANWASEGLFDKKPFDTQDSDRYRAETVLRTAATNPEMYKRLTQSIPQTLPTAKPSAPVTAATTPAPVPTPAPAPAATPTPAAPTPAAPAPAPAAPAAPSTPPPPTATPPRNNYTLPRPNLNRPAGLPSAADFIRDNTPQPRKEGIIDGKPFSQWMAENKKRQQKDTAAYAKTNTSTPAASGMTYDSVSGQMVPQGFNRYKTNTPAPVVKPQAQTTSPVAPVSRPLTPEAQKMLDNYRKSPAGQFQSMPSDRIRSGLISDANYRINQGLNPLYDRPLKKNRQSR